MALEKPTRGKPVKERKSFYYLLKKKSDIHLQSKSTYLNQRKSPSRLSRFICKAASFSVHKSSQKMCKNYQQPPILNFCATEQLTQPSKSVPK